MKRICTPLEKEIISGLKAGDELLLNGIIYTARDAAHLQMIKDLEAGLPLPFDINNATIYYVGPCPAKDGEIIGSCGPTTSGRMDKYAPTLIKMGLSAMIGKGIRDKSVVDAMIKYKCVYLGAVGGAGAYYSKCVKSCKLIAYPHLLSEGIYELEVEDFPVTVINDIYGNCLYK